MEYNVVTVFNTSKLLLNGIAEPFTLAADVQRSQLQTETWFHGVITRIAAEQLLVNDGDFLVRESETKPGQYVLTGLQDAKPRHLLLMDPNGVVSINHYQFVIVQQ